MPTLFVPTRASSSLPFVRQRVRLDSRDYFLDFDWNGREARWYCHVSTSDGTLVVGGRKVVAGGAIGSRQVGEGALEGRLAAVDVSGRGLDPGIDDLGSRVLLAYLTGADRRAIFGPFPATPPAPVVIPLGEG